MGAAISGLLLHRRGSMSRTPWDSPGTGCDLVYLSDCPHDMANPVGAARRNPFNLTLEARP